MELVTFRNQTRETVLVQRASKTGHPGQRFLGLMLQPALGPDEGLWLIPCRAIHTIGMRFPIDAIYLDKDLIVVGLSQSLRPFRIGKMLRKAYSVLEVRAGTAADSGTRVGDQLTSRPADPLRSDCGDGS
jgi:uncharacterized membrane protein (UPF0127 family)